MFYCLADTQGIKTTINIGTFASSCTPLVAIDPASAPSPTSVIGGLYLVLEVDHLVGGATTLLMEEPTSPLTLIKRARGER